MQYAKYKFELVALPDRNSRYVTHDGTMTKYYAGGLFATNLQLIEPTSPSNMVFDGRVSDLKIISDSECKGIVHHWCMNENKMCNRYAFHCTDVDFDPARPFLKLNQNVYFTIRANTSSANGTFCIDRIIPKSIVSMTE